MAVDADVKIDITKELVALQKPTQSYLWTPADMITFTPAVLAQTFGDGRALFGLTTINNRPAYWLFRGCSSWKVSDYDAPDGAPELSEFIDDVLWAIEEEFGGVSCYERNARGTWIDSETKQFVPRAWVEFPVIDSETGCNWWREDWPDIDGIELVAHPFAPRVRILSDSTS